ncbi:MAG: glycosyltransferase family 9 protein [Bdellovibrionales bacterium]|nr:glycosyltransferase family 9 protein [Bdellovibrionales bacterium]
MRPFLTRPKKLLAIKLRPLGETVIFSAALDALKNSYPDTQIHVAVTTEWAPLLIHHPAISRIWPVDRHEDKFARARAIARAAFKLRNENFDAALNFHASPSSATLAFATGAKVRSIHFHSAQDKNRYSTVDIPDRGLIKSVLEKDLDVIRALGLSIPVGKYRPFVSLKPSEMDEGFRLISSLGLRRPVMIIGLGATRPTKCWPENYFAELATRWRDEVGSVLLITGPSESERAAAVFKLIENNDRISHLHDPSIRLLSAVFSQASVFVGNDSGVKHVAAASGLPTVTLFGPEDPVEWHVYPRDNHPYFYIENLNCRRDNLPHYPAWCSIQECIQEKHRCMKEILPQSVYNSCKKVMK